MRKNAKKYLTLNCNFCNNLIIKELKEYNRQIKKGNNKFYCNCSCSAKANKVLMANAEYCKNNPEEAIKKLNSFPRKYRTKDEYSIFRYLISKIKQRIKTLNNKNKPEKNQFNLDEITLKEKWDNQNGLCPYTGIEMKFPKQHIKNGCDKVSLDRINSDNGYTNENTEFVSLFINYAKNGFTKEQVIEFLKQIVKNANDGKIKYLNS